MQVDRAIQLRDTLGQGGMGSVFRADHAGLGCEVAVKVLREDLITPDAKARLLREARLTARIANPHVVRVLDCPTAKNGSPYLVLERVTGRELAVHLREHGRLAVREVCAVITQLSCALEAVHAARIVHADVKPENVILHTGDGGKLRATLIDFGIARSDDEAPLYEDAFPTGTPSAMSPEQILDPRTARKSWDVWGLAVLAYTALTGEQPYDGENLASVLFAAARGDRRSVTWFRRELGAGIDEVFDRAFARLPEDRYQTTKEFARAFAAALLAPMHKRERLAA